LTYDQHTQVGRDPLALLLKEMTIVPSCTNFVEHKNETLALRFAPAYLFLYQSVMAPSWVTRIKHEEDDVGLINDFVQHTDVVSPLLFLRLVAPAMREGVLEEVAWLAEETRRGM